MILFIYLFIYLFIIFQFSDVASLTSIPRGINHQMVIGF
jgi:hypothetical protein